MTTPTPMSQAERLMRERAEREGWTADRLQAALTALHSREGTGSGATPGGATWGGTGAQSQEATQEDQGPGWKPPRNPVWSSANSRAFYQIRDMLLEES